MQKAENVFAALHKLGQAGQPLTRIYRQLFNENGGDAQKAEADFRAIARAGGYGDVELDQALDIRSLSRSVDENKRRADQADVRPSSGAPTIWGGRWPASPTSCIINTCLASRRRCSTASRTSSRCG